MTTKKPKVRTSPKHHKSELKRSKCISVNDLEQRVISAMASIWKVNESMAVINCVLAKWEEMVAQEPTLKYKVFAMPRDAELAKLEDTIHGYGLDEKLEQYKKIFPDASTSELIGAAKGIIADKEIADKLNELNKK